MLIWRLAHMHCRHRVQVSADMTHSLRPVEPWWLLEHLPKLGNVLYVHGAPVGPVPAGSGAAESVNCDAASRPMLDARWLSGSSSITADGPRLCCQCLDRHGRVLARLHGLPETDGTAWDELVGPPGPPARDAVRPVVRLFRPSRARVVCFALRRVAGRATVRQRVPDQPCSSISRRVAEQLARSEALCLS